jgi:GntR family transcriptional regulator, transcriptional repressor for pyruvate dehydrogenase complex
MSEIGGHIGSVERVPMYDVVARRLRRAIHLGDVLPGESFPPERELAETLGVSRVTLREALRVLEAEGYVSIKRGRDARLVLLPRSESVDVLRARVLDRYQELQAVFEYRQAIEAAAASLAATRRSEHDLEVAEAAIEDLKRSRDMPTFRRVDAIFHLAVADAAQNSWLREAIEDTRAAMFLPLDLFGLSIPFAASITQHRKILVAIRKQDARAAERAMITHIQTTRQDLDDALSATERAE